MDKDRVIELLNQILELELAGVVRNTHYSLMVFGRNRIPLVAWFRAEANESLTHATQAGEYITSLGGHPSLKIGSLLETHQHEIDTMLTESMEHEKRGMEMYKQLMKLVEGHDIRLEEYARSMVRTELEHLDEVKKMLRSPDDD